LLLLMIIFQHPTDAEDEGEEGEEDSDAHDNDDWGLSARTHVGR